MAELPLQQHGEHEGADEEQSEATGGGAAPVASWSSRGCWRMCGYRGELEQSKLLAELPVGAGSIDRSS